ncbi:hypothetical protein HanRHA438_Chr17g0835981 [Helianthus annuus]|nr:hypothetical protein HanRHA438_Chr17g0835981 [Helianthus annuus]
MVGKLDRTVRLPFLFGPGCIKWALQTMWALHSSILNRPVAKMA